MATSRRGLRPQITNIIFGDSEDVTNHIKALEAARGKSSTTKATSECTKRVNGANISARSDTGSRIEGKKEYSQVDLSNSANIDAKDEYSAQHDSAALFKFVEQQEDLSRQRPGKSVNDVPTLTTVQRTRATEELDRIKQREHITPEERRRLIDAAMRMDPIKIARSAVLSRDEAVRESIISGEEGAFLTGSLGISIDDDSTSDEKFSRALDEVERVRRRMLARANQSQSMPSMPLLQAGVPSPGKLQSQLRGEATRRSRVRSQSPPPSPKVSPRRTSRRPRRMHDHDHDGEGEVRLGFAAPIAGVAANGLLPAPPPVQLSTPPPRDGRMGSIEKNVRSAVANYYVDLLDASPSADSDSKASSSDDSYTDFYVTKATDGDEYESEQRRGISARKKEKHDRERRRRDERLRAQQQAQRSAECMAEELERHRVQASLMSGWDDGYAGRDTPMMQSRRPTVDAKETVRGDASMGAAREGSDIPRLALLGRPTSAGAASVDDRDDLSARTDDMFMRDDDAKSLWEDLGGSGRSGDGYGDREGAPSGPLSAHTDDMFLSEGKDAFASLKNGHGDIAEALTRGMTLEQSIDIDGDKDVENDGSAMGEASHFLSADDDDGGGEMQGKVFEEMQGHGQEVDSHMKLPKFTSLGTPAVLQRRRRTTDRADDDYGNDDDHHHHPSHHHDDEHGDTRVTGTTSIQDWISFSRAQQGSTSRQPTPCRSSLGSLLSGLGRDQERDDVQLSDLRGALDTLEHQMALSSAPREDITSLSSLNHETEVGDYPRDNNPEERVHHRTSMEYSGARVLEDIASPIRSGRRNQRVQERTNPRWGQAAAGQALAAAMNAGDVAGRMLAQAMQPKELK